MFRVRHAEITVELLRLGRRRPFSFEKSSFEKYGSSNKKMNFCSLIYSYRKSSRDLGKIIHF